MLLQAYISAHSDHGQPCRASRKTILVASMKNCFDAQTDISQRDKVLFCFGCLGCLCRLLTENSELASLKSLKSVMKIRRPKILKWKKKEISVNKNNNNNKKNCQPQRMKDHDTCMCIFDESVSW